MTVRKSGERGLKGRAVSETGKGSVVHFEVASFQKSRWVRAAQQDGLKLVPWIMQTLDAKACSVSSGEVLHDPEEGLRDDPA